MEYQINGVDGALEEGDEDIIPLDWARKIK